MVKIDTYDVFIYVRELLCSYFGDIEGIFLSGSQNYSKNVSQITSDFDFHILLDLDKIIENDYFIKSNRYGERVEIKGFSRSQELDILDNTILADFFILPLQSFYDVNKLVSTHCLYAAASNLISSRFIFDPKNNIQKIKKEINLLFFKPEYITSRMKYVKDLSRTKLLDFNEDNTAQKHYYRSLWEGPIWALLNAGNIILTHECLTPTFIRNFYELEKILIGLNQQELLLELVSAWGFNNLFEDKIKYLLEHVKEDISINKIPNNYLINSLRYKYWMQYIDYYYSKGERYVVAFALTYVYFRINNQTSYQNNENINFKNNFGSLISTLGFEENNIQNKIKAIEKVIERIYDIMKLIDFPKHT